MDTEKRKRLSVMSKPLAGLLRSMVGAHYRGDSGAFRAASAQASAHCRNACHDAIADDIDSLWSVKPAAGVPAELVGVLSLNTSAPTLDAMFLTDHVRRSLADFASEAAVAHKLEQLGVQRRRRLLFHGPPGCGKTMAAAALACSVSVPCYDVKFSGVFSSFLGGTSAILGKLFAWIDTQNAVFVFNEVDAIAFSRWEYDSAAGERSSIVASLLQLLDGMRGEAVIVATTNRLEAVDPAVLRRFETTLEFPEPSTAMLAGLIHARLSGLGVTEPAALSVAESLLAGSSKRVPFSDASLWCDAAIRRMVLSGRDTIDLPYLCE